MKKILIIILIFFSVVLFGEEFNISESNLPGSPNVVFIDTKGEYVSLSLFVKFGENQPGLAHLCEHLAFGTNSKMKNGDLDYICESMGATCDAYTNYDYSVYKIVVKRNYLPQILENLSYALLTPTPRENELKIEKKIIKDELSGREGVTFDFVRYTLQRTLYGDTYYGIPIEGDDISQIPLEDVQSFYNNNYIPKNVSIIIAGEVDKEKILQCIKTYFPPSPKNSFNIPIDTKLEGENLVISGSKNYFGIMFNMAPSIFTREAVACDVVSQLVDLLSNRSIKEKYKYKSTYIHNTGKWASPFSLVYEGEDTEFVKEEILKATEKVKIGDFTEYDLQDAKNIILSDYLGKNTQIQNVTYNVGFNYVMYDFDTAVTYDQLIKKVSKPDIMTMANKYLATYSTV